MHEVDVLVHGGDHGGSEDGDEATGTIKKKGWAGSRRLLTGRLLAKGFSSGTRDGGEDEDERDGDRVLGERVGVVRADDSCAPTPCSAPARK
jgi:hypothetical protein